MDTVAILLSLYRRIVVAALLPASSHEARVAQRVTPRSLCGYPARHVEPKKAAIAHTNLDRTIGLSCLEAGGAALRPARPLPPRGQPLLAVVHLRDDCGLAGYQRRVCDAVRTKPRRRRQYHAGLVQRCVLLQCRDAGHCWIRRDGAGHPLRSYRLGGGDC